MLTVNGKKDSFKFLETFFAVNGCVNHGGQNCNMMNTIPV